MYNTFGSQCINYFLLNEVFGMNIWREKPLKRPGSTRLDSIKMDLKEISYYSDLQTISGKWNNWN
jgi:hypothetical protein